MTGKVGLQRRNGVPGCQYSTFLGGTGFQIAITRHSSAGMVPPRPSTPRFPRRQQIKPATISAIRPRGCSRVLRELEASTGLGGACLENPGRVRVSGSQIRASTDGTKHTGDAMRTGPDGIKHLASGFERTASPIATTRLFLSEAPVATADARDIGCQNLTRIRLACVIPWSHKGARDERRRHHEGDGEDPGHAGTKP